MKVLALNWRDIRHPEAGGAEVHLHEILSHLVRWGHEATEIASGWPGCPAEETVDGVRILRRAHWFDANLALPVFARRHLQHRTYDVVIEDINKVPFFMPLYTSTPVVPVIPHLFGTTAFLEANPLVASYVVAMERFIPRVFRRCRFEVISPSTSDDLVARGIPAERIRVVLCGLDHRRFRRIDVAKFDRPTIVHLGRLRKYKSVEVAMRAMAKVRASIPAARLVIIGGGPYERALRAEAARLGLGDGIEFLGHLESEELTAFLNRAHLLVNPSPKEGWGLTVVEANACGLPVVASDRPGLRDSVADGVTGFLVPYGDTDAFASRSIALLSDEALWDRMSTAALDRVASFTWERCARETLAYLDEILEGKRRGS